MCVTYCYIVQVLALPSPSLESEKTDERSW